MMNYHGMIFLLMMTFSSGASLHAETPDTARGANVGEALSVRADIKGIKGDSSISTGIRFPLNGSSLDKSSRDRLDTFSSRIDSIAARDVITSIDIAGSSSPDGPEKINDRLASDRASALFLYLFSDKDLDPSLFNIYSHGEDWLRLREYILADSLVPNKESVIAIIDSDISLSEKESRLRKLSGGKTWRHLAGAIFPLLRSASVNVRFLNNSPLAETVLFKEETLGNTGSALPPPEFANLLITNRLRKQILI